jgi:hypothetical protein
MVDHVHVVSFDDQIADREDQTVVADHDAGALALGPERRRAPRIRHGAHRHFNDRVEKSVGRRVFRCCFVRAA